MADFFCSRGSLLVAGILLLAGCACFFNWREDADSAGREKTTVGVIDGVSRSGYYFEFELDGVKIYAASSSCETALTPRGCEVGAPVRVYYDPNPTHRAKLKELGAVGGAEFVTGVDFVFVGMMLIVLHFLTLRVLGPDESDESDEDDIDVDRPDEGPETIHVVPGK
jgi:hypothetical protein